MLWRLPHRTRAFYYVVVVSLETRGTRLDVAILKFLRENYHWELKSLRKVSSCIRNDKESADRLKLKFVEISRIDYWQRLGWKLIFIWWQICGRSKRRRKPTANLWSFLFCCLSLIMTPKNGMLIKKMMISSRRYFLQFHTVQARVESERGLFPSPWCASRSHHRLECRRMGKMRRAKRHKNSRDSEEEKNVFEKHKKC